jgi:formylglycine-generating enzyme required for sulfatase activity
MSEQARVFVSHHHSPEEDSFTRRLVDDLRTAGADVWVDEGDIVHGSFVAKISEGMAGRQWLVLVMTPAALASPWVRSEVETAIAETTAERMLGVLPIVMSVCAEEEIPILWRKLHRYDATADYETARDGLLRALRLQMPVPTVNQAPISSSVQPPMLRSSVPKGLLLPQMCDVPEGPFLMGSDPKRDKNASPRDQPQHRVMVAAFQIGKYPVTVAEFAWFVASGRSKGWAPNLTGDEEAGSWRGQQQLSYHPVRYISWENATGYAAWLVEITGEPWRLATEAEWEKAARGTDGRVYPWGDKFDRRRCNGASIIGGSTTPVDSHPNGVSPYGVREMVGNVWEWTSSLYKPYPYHADDGREDSRSHENRVMRGGSWSSNVWDLRAAARLSEYYTRFDGGFRVARSVPSS